MTSAYEREADKFDMELFRLIRRSETLGEEAPPRFRALWREVGQKLRAARPNVRSMMSEEDKKRNPQ